MMLEGKRIFLVEDNPTNLAVIAQLLEQHGAEVAYDRWGVETVQRLLHWLPIDLILLDLMFPGDVTGFDIYEDIQSDPELADIPVVIVSANTDDEMVNKAVGLGLRGYIAKPLFPDTFPDLIERAVNGEDVWHV